MSAFVQGSLTKENVLVEVTGIPGKYRYRWWKQLESTPEKKIDYTQYLPVMIVDFSYSMLNTSSAQPAMEATKKLCSELFDKGFPEVLLVFFGQTPYAFLVIKNNYISEIDNVLTYYFTSQDNFGRYGKFIANATVPTLAFEAALNYIKAQQHTNVLMSFMTDGQFNHLRADQKKNSQFLQLVIKMII